MIAQYALIFTATLMLTFVSIAVLKRAAPRLGLLDQPTGRKAHRAPTPVIGGLAMLFALAVALAIGGLLLLPVETAASYIKNHKSFVVCLGVLAMTGALDDRWPIPARYKLLIQLACCLAVVEIDGAVVGDVGLTFGDQVLTVGPFSKPFTVLVMLTITNALNMIDGIDGLCSGIAISALAVLGYAALDAGNTTNAIFILALSGALVAFMTQNFPWRRGRPAKVFMGDCGSLLCGFAIAYLCVQMSAQPSRVVKPSTTLWFFFIPVVDTIWLYLRRTVFGRTPFAPGRDHIHHLLLEKFPPRTVTLMLVGASLVLSVGAYVLERVGVRSWPLISAWLCLFFLYGVLTHRPWRIAWRRSHAPADPVKA